MALTVSVDEIVQGSRSPLLGARPHWKRIRLGDIASVLNGFAFKSAQFTKGDGMPLIRIRDVGSASTDTNYVGEFENRYIVEPGDLLIGMDGDFNCARWRGPRGLLNQRVCKVMLRSEQYHPRFLDFALPGYLKAINDATSSVTVKHLSSRTIEDIPLPFPPLHEQEEIVAELEKQFSRLDEAVANLKRVKANLKRYKAAVLDVAVKGRIRAKGAASDDELPTGWRWSSVGELATVGTGATPARSNEAFYRGGTIPWITSSAVNEPFVDTAEQFVTDEALRETNLTLYPPGTLLVAMYGEGKTRGKCSELRIAATTNQALAALQVDPAVRRWLKMFLEHNYDNTRRIASGGVQPNLNLGLIRAIRLPLPPVNERRRIVAEVERRLSVLAEPEYQVDCNLSRAQVTRASLLSKAFGSAR